MPDPIQLPQLTGASLSALLPNPAITELLARMSMPAPNLTTPELLTPEQILPFTQARAAEMSPVTTPPYTPPQGQRPGFLSGLISALQRGVMAGMTSDPGAALLRMSEQDSALKEQRRREELARQDRTEDRRYQEQQRQREMGIQLAMQESAQQRQDRQEEEREHRLDERDRREFMQRQEEILGQRTFQEKQAELEHLWQDKRDTERRKLDEEKIKLTERQQRNQLTKEYRRLGAGKYTKELVDYDLGLNETLSPEAQKKSDQIGRVAARGAGGGGQGGGSGRAIVELVDAQGNVLGRMPYSQVKFNDTGEIQGFPGATLRFPQPTTGPPTQEDVFNEVQARKARGDSDASIRSFLHGQKISEKVIEEALKRSTSPPAPAGLMQRLLPKRQKSEQELEQERLGKQAVF
jgi:hypothetical protein